MKQLWQLEYITIIVDLMKPGSIIVMIPIPLNHDKISFSS